MPLVLAKITDSVDASYNRELGFDKIDRLISANGPWGTGTLAYDGKGNIVANYMGGLGLNYVYDSKNRLSSVSGYRTANFGYDLNGNIISGFDNYLYDEASRLTCVNCNNPATKIEYRYDGQNQRVMVVKNGIKTYEVYDLNGKLLIEFTPAQENKLVEHIYLNGKQIAQRVANQ